MNIPETASKFRGGNKITETPVWMVSGRERRRTPPWTNRTNSHASSSASCRTWTPLTIWRAGWQATTRTPRTSSRRPACARSSSLAGSAGGDSRSWLLRIVRNSFYDWLRQQRRGELATPFDEEVHDAPPGSPAPDAALLEKADKELLHQAIEALPVEYREVLVMRELEGLSYKEIAEVAELPIGTVMSRLARAREQLRLGLMERLQRGMR